MQSLVNLDLSICIVTLDSLDLLRACLRSIYEQTHTARFEIIVVDNHSQDGTPEFLREHYPDIRLVVNDSNAGYSRANNQALALVRSPYALLLNPDTVILPNALDQLVEFAEAHPQVGIVGPKVLNRDGTMQLQCRRSFATPWDLICYFTRLSKIFPKSGLFARYLVTYRDENEIHPVPAISGACMLIRQAMMQQIGLLDEQFFAYQEDTDYCYRAHQAGWQVYYYPPAHIVHYASRGGSRVDPYRSIIEWHRSYWRYYRKHLAARYFFLFNWIYYVIMLLKLLSSLAVNLFRGDKFAGSQKP